MSLVENAIFIPDVNPGISYTEPVSHFGRVKLGEIFKVRENLIEFVCLHCSQAFQSLDQFTAHVNEHFTGIVSTSAQTQILTSKENNSYDIFSSIEENIDDCIGMSSDSDNITEEDESGAEYLESTESSGGIAEQIKQRLAEDNLILNDDSAVGAEYARYLYVHRFRKANGQFECPKCEYRSEKQNDIRRHVFRHLDQRVFTCTICSKTLSSIRNHRDSHHRQDGVRMRNESMESTRKQMAATSYGGENGSFSGINDDIRKRLAKDNFEIDDSFEAQEYSKYMYDYKFSKTNGQFQCPKCDFTSRQNRIVRRHIFKHLHRNIFTCLVCDMKVSSFSRHKELHAKSKQTGSESNNDNHDDGTNEWNHTSATVKMDYYDSNETNERGQLNTSSRRVDPTIKVRLAKDNFEIDDSIEAIEYSQYLFEYKFHSENGIFKCPKCKYTSGQNHHVRRHIFGHLNRKIFRCTLCNKKMSHISRLVSHKSFH